MRRGDVGAQSDWRSIAIAASINNGLTRYKEAERVMVMFKNELHLPVDCVDIHGENVERVERSVRSGKEGKIIGKEFIGASKEYKKTVEKKTGVVPEIFGPRDVIPGRDRILSATGRIKTFPFGPNRTPQRRRFTERTRLRVD